MEVGVAVGWSGVAVASQSRCSRSRSAVAVALGAAQEMPLHVSVGLSGMGPHTEPHALGNRRLPDQHLDHHLHPHLDHLDHHHPSHLRYDPTCGGRCSAPPTSPSRRNSRQPPPLTVSQPAPCYVPSPAPRCPRWRSSECADLLRRPLLTHDPCRPHHPPPPRHHHPHRPHPHPPRPQASAPLAPGQAGSPLRAFWKRPNCNTRGRRWTCRRSHGTQPALGWCGRCGRPKSENGSASVGVSDCAG